MRRTVRRASARTAASTHFRMFLSDGSGRARVAYCTVSSTSPRRSRPLAFRGAARVAAFARFISVHDALHERMTDDVLGTKPGKCDPAHFPEHLVRVHKTAFLSAGEI